MRTSDSKVPVEAAPLHGEHTDDIYRELLGMTPEKIEGLGREKAI